MATQTRARTTSERSHEDTQERTEKPSTDEERVAKLKAETDELLDEIDEALGENATFAQEFVNSYVQKGGE